ncbi:MAG: helix-turn-helix domain-containing protein [Bacteroidales bacterium]|nr:helix-turn-helix domain-containing protein [Bacteroidales bacterium]
MKFNFPTRLAVLITVISILSVFPAGAGPVEYSFYQVSVEDGLSHPNVLSLLTDRRGSLWIGTVNGLNRYDNQTMRTYSSLGDDGSSLPDSRIEDLAEGGDGRIWAITRFGLGLYDLDGDTFQTVSRETVWSSLVLEDRVVFGSQGCLLQIKNGSNDIQTIPLFDNKGATHRIVSVKRLGDGRLLLGTRDSGLFIHNLDTGETVPFTDSVHPHMVSMRTASDGTVYAAFFGDGFYRYDPSGKETGHFTTRNSGLSNDYVQDFLEYEDTLWIATDGGGLCLFDPISNSFINIVQNPDDALGLPTNSVTVLYEDSMGNLWGGSVKKGFFQIRRNYITTYKGRNRGLSDDAVSSLYRDRDGRLWVGTDGGGLHWFDPEKGRFISCPGTAGTKVISIAGLGDDKLLLSFYTKGFFTFDKRDGSLKPFIIVDEETNWRVCFSGYLPRAGETPDGNICILSDSPWIYNVRERTFTPMPVEDGNMAVDGLRMAYSDDKISLFFRDGTATDGDGTVLISRWEDGVLRPLFSAGGHTMISSIASDGENHIWVGTEHGLGRYDLKTGEYSAIKTTLFANVTALETDRDGRTWICADNRLFTYLPEGRFASWNKSDGFLPNNIKMMYQNSRDESAIYLGGSGGLVKIERGIPIPEEKEPELFLERMSINGLPITKVRQDTSVRVRKNQFQALEAFFLAKYYDVFQRKLFRYTVQNNQDSYSIDSYEPRLYLPELPSGNYRILASCLTKDGTFSEPREMLKLTVTPPWYRTGWFHTLMAILLTGVGVYVIIYFREKHEKANKESMAQFLEGILNSSDDPEGEAKQKVEASERSAFLTRVDSIIMDNLSNPELGVQLLCKEIPMSRTSLYNRLKKETGLGVNDYINRLRIERSVDLLLTTDLTISEISYEVGFSYPRYFSTSFKNMKGMTPTRFKLENKNKQTDSNG